MENSVEALPFSEDIWSIEASYIYTNQGASMILFEDVKKFIFLIML
jgi:hypothetical protein